jgi:hypothetical protein
MDEHSSKAAHIAFYTDMQGINKRVAEFWDVVLPPTFTLRRKAVGCYCVTDYMASVPRRQ